jgi:hypothetical protein
VSLLDTVFAAYFGCSASVFLTMIFGQLDLTPVAEARTMPALIVPTEAGRPWRIIQGYGCGTHNAWDRYSLDLAAAEGPTYHTPVRAAASGKIWAYSGGSGTLILDHGDGFFTMYTHMASVVTTRIGTSFEQGEIIGSVGDRGSPGVPHLHFTAFTASSYRMSSWQSQPLTFVEGYDLPERGGCNQHGGTVLVGATLSDPIITAQTDLVAGQWYTASQRIEFQVTGGIGISQGWNSEPTGEPMFPRAREGYADLSEAGEGLHTLHIVAHAADGRRTVQTVGPFGFDQSPPRMTVVSGLLPEVTLPISGGQVSWLPAFDAGSGVAGYRLYVGPDPVGTSEWYVEEPQVTLGEMAAGSYHLRVKPIDRLGHNGEWITVATIVVQ